MGSEQHALAALRQLPRELSLPALDQTKVQLSGPGGREPCAPPTATQDDAASVSSGGSANEAARSTPGNSAYCCVSVSTKGIKIAAERAAAMSPRRNAASPKSSR